MKLEDTDRILDNVTTLKGNETYKGISVTDDSTIQERNLIKTMG